MSSDSVIGVREGPIASVEMGLPGDHAGKTATRVFFVIGGNQLALVDSGIHVGYPSLMRGFGEIGRAREDLSLLLVSHEHMDHIGNNGPLKRDTGCRILGHAARADRIADNMLNARTIVHAFPEGEQFDLNSEYLDWMAPEEGPLDGFLVEGDNMDLGGGVILEVVECFGHSMAEIGFYELSSRALIIADPLLPIFNPVLYLYEDPEVMRATFDKLEAFIEDRGVETVFLAHEEPRQKESALELIDDCRSRVDGVERSMLDHIARNPGIGRAALRDLVCDEFEKVREWRALVSVNASLESFESKGMIRRRDTGWCTA